MTMDPAGEASGTVFARFEAMANRFPGRPFQVVLPETATAYGIAAEEITYGDMLARVRSRRDAYRRAGYGPGHRVGLLLRNRPDFLIHWFALNGLGASIVPINPDLRAAELEYLIGHSGMVLAVSLEERIGELERAGDAIGASIDVVAPDADCPAAPRPCVTPAPPDESECALLYTSGTTGRPKGCVLTNAYFLGAGDWYAGIGGLCSLRRDPPERMLTPLPLFHMNALAYSVMAMVTVGGAIAVLDRFHPRSWWSSVRAFEASVVHYLGVMPAMLMTADPSPSDRDHYVRFGFGAGVPAALHAPFEERFGFPLLEAWAMTETGAGAVVIANEEPRRIGTSCFGRPAPAVEVAIRRDDGADAGIGGPGELLVRAAGEDPRRGFFQAYLKDPAATDAAWEGGWFHTGDVVSRDADGQLHFVDRKKNVIRRSGENISAVEVESVLGEHPAVAQVAVAATPDPIRGDEVAALVVAREKIDDAQAAQRLAAEIVRHALSRLAYYKAPGYVAFVSALPLTSTEKIQRGALKQDVARIMAGGEAIDTRPMKKRSV